MCAKNMWGNLEDIERKSIRTPLAILREQSQLLSKATKGILLGAVGTSGSGEDIELRLYIRVPALNNYTYHVLRARHNIINIYPIYVSSDALEKDMDCRDEAQFLSVLEQILSSTKVGNVIRVLMSQVEE